MKLMSKARPGAFLLLLALLVLLSATSCLSQGPREQEVPAEAQNSAKEDEKEKNEEVKETEKEVAKENTQEK